MEERRGCTTMIRVEEQNLNAASVGRGDDEMKMLALTR
jgi:hypothetical protein